MPTGMSDAELVKLARKRDGEAFRMLVELYNERIFVYLSGCIGRTEEVYDLTQRTFFKAWCNLSQLHDGSKFKSWLYSIARNEARDWLRNKKKKAPIESWEQLELQGIFVSRPGPEDEVTEADFFERVLAELSPNYRDCYLLQMQGFKLAEIAEILGISTKTATTYVCSVRRRLGEEYRRLQSDKNTNAERDVKS